ncbi:heme-dependent oxidative N-demethylase family protein [Rhodovibrionaceae bacterium A322]
MPLSPAPQFPPFLPFASGKFRLSMGLMALKPEDWLDLDSSYATYLAEKQRLLDTREDEVYACLPESQPACQELLEVVCQTLSDAHPDLFHLKDRRFSNGLTDQSFPLDKTDCCPLKLAALQTQEDLLLLQQNDEGGPYRLTAAALCFPTRWLLQEKVGQEMLGIHGPVPAYQKALGKPVDRFMSLLKPEKPVWRVNWALTDNDALFQPTGKSRVDDDPGFTLDKVGDQVFLRLERQTLRRLPNSGAIVFGIRIYQHPLRSLEAQPKAALGLARTIADLPPDMASYKSVRPFRKVMLEYLESVAEKAAAD